ncbi:ribonuclease HI [Desulfurispira natronophila]|uniref:Ribonuclease H n=1 Tax=Desulfurispira natronophila TaxID=682562 RepID=A0A7W7Y3B0_9BACT|nr:ribonuclease HI [Desulfurispira natronophila]MBB5021320.1 ribonuclease HI [Desulfurispira natronophila]
MKHIKFYSDGSCLGNPGPGGYAAILCYQSHDGQEHEKTVEGYQANTTNNQMELQAVISGLRALREPCQIDLYTDSNYLKNGITSWIHQWKRNGWKTSNKKPVANRDYWVELDALARNHQINWHWVKAHNGHIMNERCDEAARKQAYLAKEQSQA